MKTHDNVNRRLVTGALGGIAFTAIGVVVSLLQFSILLRRLTLESAGLWMVFTNLGSYVFFFDLALSPTLGREVSFASANPLPTEAGRAAQIGTLIRSCTKLVSIFAFIIAVVGAAGGWTYLRTIVPPALASTARPAWFVYVAGAALNLVGEGWFAGIYGLGHVFHEKMLRSAGAVIGLLFMSIAIFSGAGFMALALAYLLQSVCLLAMARTVLGRLAPEAVAAGSFDLAVIRGLMGPSLKYAATLLGGILILQTDNIIIASILGPKAIPNYQAVAKMITILMGVSMILVMTSLPVFSQAYARNDVTAMTELLQRNLRFCLGVMVILGSFLACFIDRFIFVWLGPNHFVGFPVAWALLIVMILELHAQIMAGAMMATGRIVFLVPALLAGILNIGASIVLARRFGLLGVVIGTMVAQLSTNHWYVPWYTMRLFKITLLQHLRKIMLPTLLMMAVMLSSGFAIRHLTNGLSAFVSEVIGGISTLVVGSLSFGILIINAQERRILFTQLRAMGLRWTMLSSNLPM